MWGLTYVRDPFHHILEQPKSYKIADSTVKLTDDNIWWIYGTSTTFMDFDFGSVLICAPEIIRAVGHPDL